MTPENIKSYYELNKEKIKRYYEANKEKRKEYYEKNKKNKIEYQKEYQKNNKEKILERRRKYEKNKLLTDPVYKLKLNIRKAIKKSFNNNGYKKTSKTFLILGCSYEQFKQHIESQFESWMAWSNYGLYNGTPNYGWDIDHKIPSSSATTEEDVIKLNHHTNLQPLCSYYNRDIKRNKID
jgi:hypothetical protein